MNIRNQITRHIILPLSDIYLGRSISKSYRNLQKSQWWNKEQIYAYQNKLLSELIKHSYENVPYYTSLFNKLKLKPEDIRTQEDLKLLPILTKEIIRNNISDFFSKEEKKYYKASSSGSTGEPLAYRLSKNAYSMNIASGMRGWNWMGYNLGDKSVKISQNIRISKEKKIQDILLQNRYETLLKIDYENCIRVLRQLEKYQPKIIRCYPDPLELMAKIVVDEKIKIHPTAIATTGNILHPKTRSIIEEAFNCPVFDAYSCEGGAAYFECPTHNCYHAADEYAISEFVDVHTTENGFKQGRLISTCLWNFSTPFIRYDSQDILEWDNTQCSCGRSLRSIKRILGRDTDVLITPKGTRLIVHIFTINFSKFHSINQFQVIQDRIDHIVINVTVNEKFDKNEEQKIQNFWQNYISDGVTVELKVVDKISASKSGKRRFLIRDESISL
jgi:phenylacetate-CoA ligase